MATFRFDPRATFISIRATMIGPTMRSVILAFDTGATTTLITRNAAFEIGLDPDMADRHTSLTTASQAETVPLLTFSRLMVMGHSSDNLDVVCKDLPLPLQMQVDGLLGLNFLRHFKLFINFPKGVLVLQEKNPRNFLQWLSQLLEIAKAHR